MVLILFLFTAELLSMFLLLFGYSFFTTMAENETSGVAMVAVPFVAVLVLETWLLHWMSRDSKVLSSLRKVLWSHCPWLLTWSYPFMIALALPEPHNFNIRKLQILLGMVLVSHFFIYARTLLTGSYKKGWKDSKIFGWTAALLFLGITFWTGTICEPSGDEPHYLLMAQSLVADGDLDLANNYQDKDYLSFYHRGDLEPQGLEHVVEGKRFSHHPLGPVLLILPGFALLGRLGAALTMALLAALALHLTLRVLEESGVKGWVLHATGVVGLFSSPLLLFCGLIYPEIPTACLVALSLLFFLETRWAWFGCCQGLMLWMHNRNVLLVLPFLGFAFYEIWKNKKQNQARRFAAKGGSAKWEFSRKTAVKNILGLTAGFAVPVMMLIIYFRSIYGVWTPLGAHNEPFTSLFRLSHFWDGFFGLLLDQECGLWFHFPIFGLIVMGGVVLYHSSNPLRFLVLGVFSFYYLFMAYYENLGLTPATRYMVGVTPLLLIMVCPAVGDLQKRAWSWWLAGFSLLSGVAVNWILSAVPWMRYNKMDGENWILKIAGSFWHLSFTATSPAFNPPVVQPHSYVISAILLGTTIALTVFFLKDKKQD